MATHIKASVSISVVVDAVDGTTAALQSDPETAALVPTWVALTAKADALAEQRRTLDREALRARVRLGVQDAMWDRTVAAFGRAVVDASGGRRDGAPYTRFFAKIAPSKAQVFGIEREVELGRGWLAELGRNPDERLAQTWAPRLKAATDALAGASSQRSQSVQALSPHQTSVVLFIDDVNLELDRLEGDLKKLFPGQPERVASYLSATRPARPTPADEPEPTPPTPTK